MIKNFFVWFFCFLLTVNISFFAFSYLTSERNAKESIPSPLPDFLGAVLGNQASASNFWEPRTPEKISKPSMEISAISAISYDLSSDTLLYAKDINTKRPMASLTKIMSAIIALEEMDIKMMIKVDKNAAEIGESVMGLSEGEELTLEDLLYGLILHSGNDASEAIAQASPFGKNGYVYIMNKKAEDLGLSNTRFTNPSGLQGDGEQYSTANDLLVMTKYALQNELFSKIVSTYQYDIPVSPTHKAFTLYNETNLLTTYPGVMGVKTGFTDEAGMCLVTYLEYNGHQIVAVLLNSMNRRQEMKDLLDYSLTSLGVKPPTVNL